jgi:hypothetical protein
MRRTLVIVAALSLGLSACGSAQTASSDRFAGEQQSVAKVVDELAKAGRAGKSERICTDILAKQLVAQLKTAGGDCVTEMDRAIDDASDYDLQVRSVKVNGDTATAQVRQGKAGSVATFSFVKEGGAWRATALGSGA